MKNVKQFAKNIGRNVTAEGVMDWLQAHGLIGEDLKPIQKYIDCGWFFVDYVNMPHGVQAIPFLTEAGQIMFAELIGNYYQ